MGRNRPLDGGTSGGHFERDRAVSAALAPEVSGPEVAQTGSRGQPRGSTLFPLWPADGVKGIRDRPTVGLELEGDLPEAYYYCPHCGEGFSPPQAAIRAGEGTVE